jgi:hypothetical protein
MEVGQVYLSNGVKMIVTRIIAGNVAVVDVEDRLIIPMQYKTLRDSDIYSLDRMKLEAILEVLDKMNWHVTYAAELLGITRCTIYDILKKNGIAYSGNDGHCDIQPAALAKACPRIRGESDLPKSEDRGGP